MKVQRYKSIFKEAKFLSVLDLEIGETYSMMSPEGFGEQIKVTGMKKNKSNKYDLYYLNSKGQERTFPNLGTSSGYDMFQKI